MKTKLLLESIVLSYLLQGGSVAVLHSGLHQQFAYRPLLVAFRRHFSKHVPQFSGSRQECEHRLALPLASASACSRC